MVEFDEFNEFNTAARGWPSPSAFGEIQGPLESW
jgi:hypothetical protein